MRKLIVLFAFCLLIVPSALSVISADTRVEVNHPGIGWEWYGYGELEGHTGWHFNEGGMYPVEQAEDDPPWYNYDVNVDEVQVPMALELVGKNEQQGYEVFRKWQEQQPEWEFTYPEKLGYTDQSETNDDSTNSQSPSNSNTNQNSQSPPKENIISDDGCGINYDQGYMKMCYNPKSLYSYDPYRDDDSIESFVEEMQRRNRIGEGFVVIAVNTDGSGSARERRVANELKAQLSKYRTQDAYVVSDTVPPAYGNNEFADMVVVLSHQAAQNPPNQLESLLSPVRSIQGTIGKAAQGNIRQAWQDQWESTTSQVDDQTGELKKEIEEQTGIRLEIRSTTGLWNTTNREQLDAQLQDQLGSDHPKPCFAYILYDREKVELYQSTRYCQLRILRDDVYREAPQEQIVQMLRSAQRNTERLNEEQLMVLAYHLVSEDRSLQENKSQGLELAEWLRKKPESEKQRAYAGADYQVDASYDIVLAKERLMKVDPQDAFDILSGNTVFEAHRRMQPLGAITALEAARQMDNCEALGETMNKYSSVLSLSQQTRNYERALQDCNYRQLQNQCKVMQSGENPLLDITFVNDGLNQEEFNTTAQAIMESMLEMPNLNAYPDRMIFKQTRSDAPITQSRGLMRTPEVDSRVVADLSSTCYGDLFVVVSDNEFYPSTLAGDAYISSSACNENIRCMTIYTARSLAFSVFNMEPEENTVTSPLSDNPGSSTLERMFSSNQRDIIREFFGGRS